MNLTIKESGELAEGILKQKTSWSAEKSAVVLCPSFESLAAVQEKLKGQATVALGAQDCFWEETGAFTGEVSARVLRELGCAYVILGHSERRQNLGETDAQVNLKVRAALRECLVPIVCVGETLEEREARKAFEIVKYQFDHSLLDLNSEEIERVVIAYEPVWAIGTGRTATPEQAEQMHSYLRRLLNEKYGEDVAARVRILYGGSVKPDNIAQLASKPNVDGALVGGASIKAESFIQIVANAGLKDLKSISSSKH